MTTMSTRREPEDNDLPGAVVDSDDHNRDSRRRKEESGKSQWELGMEFNRRKTGLYLYGLGCVLTGMEELISNAVRLLPHSKGDTYGTLTLIHSFKPSSPWCLNKSLTNIDH